MKTRLHTVAETQSFIRDAGVSADDRAADPKAGDEVQGSGRVRKRRFAGRGKGKSGGYRVLTAYFGPDAPVYVLALLSKGERSNFTPKEIAAFKIVTAEISRHWREKSK
jgi:hypothetical protein